LLLFTTLQPNSGVLHIIGITMLMGLGMSNVMAPCTDSIMGSLPRAKAGVGSAVNDTTRQMGGAIGVAVFGSIMASHFTSEVTRKLSGTLPPELLTVVRDNVGQAIGIANQGSSAQPFADQIIRASGESFVSGLHIVGIAAAGITLLAAIGVAIFLPSRALADAPVIDGDASEEPAFPVGAGVAG
jgi:hypothetical protein